MVEARNFTISHRLGPKCRAIVVIPARNEEAAIAECLGAFAQQERIDPNDFEIILFLNNCTDNTAARVGSFKKSYPHLFLHICQAELPPSKANIGNVRRMLMDKACERFLLAGKENGAILTTDADTRVDRHWIANNLEELSRGVDAVGGRITLKQRELLSLSSTVRRRYFWDTAYSLLLAKLESQLDPLDWDPWPRHHQNFCGSLAITASMYRRAGGIPKVRTLEDIALCGSVSRANGKVRHSPRVKAFTSARLQGRVDVGLSSHLQGFATEEIPKVESVRRSAEKFALAGTIRRRGGNYSEIVAAQRDMEEHWRDTQRMPINLAIRELNKITNLYLNSTFIPLGNETNRLMRGLPFGIC